MFFRKKLLHSSQTLRAASLGQDRYRRRYWVLPHLGGIFVEGAEGERGWGWGRAGGPHGATCPHFSPAAPEERPEEPPEQKAPCPVPAVKEEPPEPEVPVPVPQRVTMNCVAARARGRPRKSKEEPPPPPVPPPVLPPIPPPMPPKSPPINGALEEPLALGQSQHDLSQSAFLSWLSQTQPSLLADAVLTPDSSPGAGDVGLPPLEASSDPTEESSTETADMQGPWFSPLPRDGRVPRTPSSAEPPPPHREQPKASARQVGAAVYGGLWRVMAGGLLLTVLCPCS